MNKHMKFTDFILGIIDCVYYNIHFIIQTKLYFFSKHKKNIKIKKIDLNKYSVIKCTIHQLLLKV